MSEQTLARCPKCGHEKGTSPIYDGEIYHGTTCQLVANGSPYTITGSGL